MEQFRSRQDKDYLHALRHSGAHLMAQAVTRLFPSVKLTVGPVTEDGFFYDMDLGGRTLTPDDLPVIEAEMKKIVKENFKVLYSEKPREEAKAFLAQQNQSYKVELVDSFPSEEAISFYQQGEFVDLCEGPHIRFTGELKHFRLLKISGAYWKGNDKGPVLQRVYGTVFPTKDELDAHITMLEEAKKRDHRELGQRLDLFSFHEWAPGSPVFHPPGTLVYNQMIDFIRELYQKYDYREVMTPQLFDSKLYALSGHLQSFREDMFEFREGEEHASYLKPMNCPGHCLFYRSKLFSYRDLPLRIAEFTRLHRNELAGALHGITRVRSFAQDDAHIFCMEEQVEAEIDRFFEFVDEVYSAFDLGAYTLKLALRPEKRLGSDEIWDKAEQTLELALKRRGAAYELKPGEGGFYGPKYEFHIKDAIGRAWQLATLQLDYNFPERFELEYVGKDSKRHRPVMLHRAAFGTIERFLGVYLEHCEGYLPTWLAPVQVAIVPVRENHNEAALRLESDLKALGIRARADIGEGNMGGKVRAASVSRIPYTAVLGDREVESGSASMKTARGESLGNLSSDALKERLLYEIRHRRPQKC